MQAFRRGDVETEMADLIAQEKASKEEQMSKQRYVEQRSRRPAGDDARA